jgi:hypothetical protein
MEPSPLPLSSRPERQRSGGTCGSADPSWKCFSTERTRISYFTALTTATYVVLFKENHKHLTEAANPNRKSAEADPSRLAVEGSAIPRTFLGRDKCDLTSRRGPEGRHQTVQPSPEGLGHRGAHPERRRCGTVPATLPNEKVGDRQKVLRHI